MDECYHGELCAVKARGQTQGVVKARGQPRGVVEAGGQTRGVAEAGRPRGQLTYTSSWSRHLRVLYC